MSELKPCLASILHAARQAEDERAAMNDRAASWRGHAEALRAAAATIAELEAAEEQMRLQASQLPVDARLASALIRKTIKSVDAMARWKDVTESGTVQRDAWRRGALELMEKQDGLAEELDVFFDAHATKHSSSGTIEARPMLSLKTVLRQGQEKAGLHAREKPASRRPA